MYTISEVADEFLAIDSMTPKKLQKLCYYAQGLYGAITEQRLFEEEIEAWIHGPVAPELYYKYKPYGYNNIPKRERTSDNKELTEIVEQIYRIYGKLDGNQLEALTHSETPWKKAREGIEPYEPSNNVISFDEMVKFFKQKILEAVSEL